MSVFSDAAPTYLALGWSPIPIWYPGGTKAPLVGEKSTGKKWTGYTSNRPTLRDIAEWNTMHPHCRSIAIRLPDDIIGIDLDLYDGKVGAWTLAKLQRKWGRLAETLMSTARNDGSCIRLYRLPAGVSSDGFTDPELWNAKGEKVSGGVDIIRASHRYMMVYPSRHPKLKTLYRWYGADFEPFEDDELPEPADVTEELPAGWCEGLMGEARERPGLRVQFSGDSGEWLRARPDGSGEPCSEMHRLLAQYSKEITQAGQLGGLHDTARQAVWALVGNAAEGCRGAYTALLELHRTFRQAMDDRRAVGKLSTRSRRETDLEFMRFMIGAIEEKSAYGLDDDDSCDMKEWA